MVLALAGKRPQNLPAVPANASDDALPRPRNVGAPVCKTRRRRGEIRPSIRREKQETREGNMKANNLQNMGDFLEEKEGQKWFFENFNIDCGNAPILIEHTDGVYNATLFEFKYAGGQFSNFIN